MCYRPRVTWLTVDNIIGPWPLVRAVEHSLPKAAYVVLVDVFSKGQLLGKHLRNADLQISRNGHVDFRSEISSFAHVPAINGTLQVECACARSPLCWLRSSVLKSSIHCIHTADSEKLLHKYGVVIGSGPTEKFPGKTLAGGGKIANITWSVSMNGSGEMTDRQAKLTRLPVESTAKSIEFRNKDVFFQVPGVGTSSELCPLLRKSRRLESHL
jgi:hypothetical protein